MFRQLMIFPRSVDSDVVERIVVEEISPAFKQSEGFRSLSMSVGPLMGPGARDDESGTVVEGTFETLETSLAAISAATFEGTKSKVEGLGARLYLFEVREH